MSIEKSTGEQARVKDHSSSNDDTIQAKASNDEHASESLEEKEVDSMGTSRINAPPLQGSTHKRGSGTSTSDAKGDDTIRSSLGSPIKRRRRYRRRNSVLIPKEDAEKWSRAVRGPTGGDQDYDHQSLPDLCGSAARYSEALSLEDPASKDKRETGTNISTNDFHASWSTSEDTRCFLELSLLNLSSTSMSMNDGLDPTESTTSFTASSHDLHQEETGSKGRQDEDATAGKS
jgi:hypothetical protein